MDAQGARITQRAPQSCQRCSSKKMRCSKTVPCEACVNQGIAAQCRREEVIISKQMRHGRSRRQRIHQPNNSQESSSLGQTQSHLMAEIYPEDTITPPSPEQEATAAMLVNFAHQPHNSGVSPQGFRQAEPANAATTVDTQIRFEKQAWGSLPDIESSPSPIQDEASPFETTLSSLEFLVWGRQREGVVSGGGLKSIPPGRNRDVDNLTQYQAIQILKYHWKWLTWTHNIIHWPRFREECELYWTDGQIPEKAWLALYYVVLCVGVHHMTPEQRVELGLTHDPDIAAILYKRCIEALTNADYASVHSLLNVQTICLLVLCAHDFNGSNLLSVLLSSAIRIAQTLNIHRLGPDPTMGASPQITLQREMKKSIWMFLSTQDWLLTPYNNAHSISPSYCITPLPTNCDGIAGLAQKMNPFKPVSMSKPTYMSYQLIMYQVANVFRDFFDKTTCLAVQDDRDAALRELYECVLDADANMDAIAKSLPPYLRTGYDDTTEQLPCYIPRQRYHLAISMAHKTLTIHGRFFLKSLTDRWFNYTKVTCVNSAKKILTQFLSNSDESTSKNLWTVLAHVVSASVILLLEMVFAHDEAEDVAAKKQLVLDCLVLLRKSTKPSTMTVRGIDLINLLLNHSNNLMHAQSRSKSAINMHVATDLHTTGCTAKPKGINIKAVADYLAQGKSANPQIGGVSDLSQYLDLNGMDFDLADLDSWIGCLDMPLI